MKTSAEDGSSTSTVAFMMISFISCMVISFSGGCAYKSHFNLASLETPQNKDIAETAISGSEVEKKLIDLSKVFVFEPENLETSYTMKDFIISDEVLSVVTDRILFNKNDDDDDDDDDDEDDDEDDEDDDDEEDDEDGSEFTDNGIQVDKASSQQLRVEIFNLESKKLRDESYLMKTFLDGLFESNLPGPLSYHCQSIQKSGISCVGILGNLPGRGHFFFYTWPENGSITFDITVSPDSLPLQNAASVFKRAFGVQYPHEGEETCLADSESTTCEVDYFSRPRSIWRVFYHGFKKKQKRESALLHDIADDILESGSEYIRPIASVQSIFQRIDVYDLIEEFPRERIDLFLKSANGGDTYEAKHPQFYEPNRIIFLDGVSQSNKYADEGYHETLVQPAMFAHPNPRRAAIIGGGEGATLREVLRHKTIEHVKMVEIDQIMVETSSKFIPTWSSCSDIADSTESCLNEPRADVIYEDAIAWFRDRTFYPRGSKEKGDNDFDLEQFDVVIVDALDPQDKSDFSEILYKDDSFLKSVFRSLSDDGIMVMQLGPAPEALDPAEEYSENANRVLVFETLERFGFASMQVYQEVSTHFSFVPKILNSFTCIQRKPNYASLRN